MRRATIFAFATITLVWHAGVPARATFPGENGRISFASWIAEDETYELFTAEPDGSDVRQVTELSSHAYSSSWSPDGKQIVVDVWDDRSIWIMDADGSDQRRLTRMRGWEGWPTWSPNGKRLAWSAGSHNREHVVVARADATYPRRIFSTQGSVLETDWSPDGRRIAFFMVTQSGGAEIFTIRPDGSGLKRLTNGAWAYDLAWAPDGRSLVYSSYRAMDQEADYALCGAPTPALRSCDFDIYLIRRDGTDEIQVTEGPWMDYEPTFSPDGEQIVFASNRPGMQGENSDAFVMNPDGSNIRLLLTTPSWDGAFAWQRVPR